MLHCLNYTLRRMSLTSADANSVHEAFPVPLNTYLSFLTLILSFLEVTCDSLRIGFLQLCVYRFLFKVHHVLRPIWAISRLLPKPMRHYLPGHAQRPIPWYQRYGQVALLFCYHSNSRNKSWYHPINELRDDSCWTLSPEVTCYVWCLAAQQPLLCAKHFSMILSLFSLFSKRVRVVFCNPS